MALYDYFTHFEPTQPLDAAKTEDPENKPPDQAKKREEI